MQVVITGVGPDHAFGRGVPDICGVLGREDQRHQARGLRVGCGADGRDTSAC